MDKGSHSSGGDIAGGDSSSSAAAYLKHLNKISHKISKPIRKPPIYDNLTAQNSQLEPRAQQSQPERAATTVAQGLQQQQPAPPQQQPPVYNINKSDFRDVVQKLTGSPAHERISTPLPIQQPKPPSSRLQRIRPPPLAQLVNHPAPIIGAAGPPLFPHNQLSIGGGFVGAQRPGLSQPLSPLPPFPAVHAAAESPISAYMRFLHSSFTSAAVASPRWNNFAPPQQNPNFPPPHPHPQQSNPPPPSSSAAILPPFPAMPSSPLPFSCLPSPRSPCALLSPNLLLSPAGQLGFPQLPLSPTVPVPSPTWKGI